MWAVCLGWAALVCHIFYVSHVWFGFAGRDECIFGCLSVCVCAYLICIMLSFFPISLGGDSVAVYILLRGHECL